MSEGKGENSAVEAKKNLLNLPSEVISYIFSFLTVLDVQAARLVCVDFYIASQAPVLLKREIVVCRGPFCGITPKLLLRSKRKFFNLSLVGTWADAWYNKKFWRSFGPTLRSLSLTCININDNQLLAILNYCPRITSLEINSCKNLLSQPIAGIKYSSPNLYHLQNLDIAYMYNPSIALFDIIVDSAPNLTSLFLEGIILLEKNPSPELQRLSHNHIFKYLRDKPNRINALSWKFHDKTFFELDKQLPNLCLIRFQTDSIEGYYIQEFLNRHRCLQYLEFTCGVRHYLLQTICQNLPDLKYLFLFCCHDTHEGMVEIPLLRKLISLGLGGCQNVTGDIFLKGLCTNVSGTLQSLTITQLTRSVSPLHMVALTKAHPSLKHLCFSNCECVTDWSVQAIFRYQTSLQSLALVRSVKLTDDGLRGTRLPARRYIRDSSSPLFKRLRELQCDDEEGYVNPSGCGVSNLKSLEKLNLNFCTGITGIFKSGLKLPRLRRIILHPDDYLTGNPLNGPFEDKRPGDSCNCKAVRDSLIPVIVEKLKRLNIIEIEDCKLRYRSVRLIKRALCEG